ncbi:hypothetical protein L208DRAFT_1266744 [Tricholoma matsutake]|nr:hypothetical protein L208DRAFT_1266744 [Tricholoma matsutake 945]
MNPLNWKDHLKCVWGYTQYDEVAKAMVEEELDTNESYLAIQDPVATLVSSNGLVFVAVIQVINICITGKSVHRISSTCLREPNVHLWGHIMKLKAISDSSHQPLQLDWE